MSNESTQEGFFSFRGHRIWYRIAGSGEGPGKLPLLCLHGGPGVPHDYLEPLETLAATGRRVMFYDQLGCGNSDQPHDPSLWTVELFLEELRTARTALGLDQFHLFGQSWGGMLAMEYALTQPPRLASLVLASAPASMPQWAAEANRLRAQLPPEVQQVLSLHEECGTTQDPAYEAAMMEFYRRYVCRLDPWPVCLIRAFTKFQQNPEVYLKMIGPSEFHIIGTLRNWDITARLGEIRVPTLVVSGRYDEATPTIAGAVQQGIPGARWVFLEHSAHMGHAEEPGVFLGAVRLFLDDVERGGACIC